MQRTPEADTDRASNPWRQSLRDRTASGDRARSAGQRDSVVVHPDDFLPCLAPVTCGDNWTGCCGSPGAHGPNLACACGSRLATWAADCLGPNELRLDPVRVYAWHQGEAAEDALDGEERS
ncbi:hypothetical protein GCM10010121_098690 [Streptomyces brasiliensis]|uniref:Uncharacterized protein n=1 Tax=Streptomyces brasiliensis TaxID=1954 RepID=A0A917UP56_9ACTN|nr:hypothetical protein GCM10010121_098690 [Streptomyces brasiliensis]